MARRGDIIRHSSDKEVAKDGRPGWLEERLKWFMSLRFGCLIHWAPYSQWDCCESWPLVPEDTWARPDTCKSWTERGKDLARFSRDYWALNRTFNPVKFDPGKWAGLFRCSGMKYVGFTTKHHDGFCMFDTRTTDYRITHPDCPFHSSGNADVVKHLFAAARKNGLAVSCYFSKSDWHSPFYWSPQFPVKDRNPNYDTSEHPEIWNSFVEFVHAQVEELMTGYGKIDVLWLDGGQVRPPKQDIDMERLASMARHHQPGLIIADRTVGGKFEDFITPEQEIPDRPLSVPWESCMTIGWSWKYVPDDRYKSSGEVVKMLAETAAKGGNLLLGIAPDPEGVFPPELEKRLLEIGEWLETNGEAIYGTQAVPPYSSGNVRFTRKDRVIYAIVLSLSAEEKSGKRIDVKGIRPEPSSRMEILGRAGTILWEETADGFAATIPAELLEVGKIFTVRIWPS